MLTKNRAAAPEQERSDQRQGAVTTSAGGAVRQQTLHNIGLIASYEYKKRVTQRSFIISTILILVLVILGACMPTVIEYFTATSNAQTKMAIVNGAGTIAGMNDDALTRYIDTALNGTPDQKAGTNTSRSSPYSIRMAPTENTSSLQKQVKDGTLSILLVLDREALGDLHFTYYTSTSNSITASDPHLSQVQALAGQLNVLDKASRMGLTPAQTSGLFAQPDFSVVNTGQGQNNRSMGDAIAGFILGYVGVILIFMSVYMYGYWVATGVAEEKGNRIMEILVNAATPFQLMAGKIVGIGAAGLTQMGAFVAVGISALLLQPPLKELLLGSNTGGLNLDITGNSITLLLLLLVYFILGFLLYASIFAAVGALVKRQEEVQNAIQLPMWLFMIGYLASFFGIYTPDATWVKVISYIPFWTPTTMLMRIGVSSVAWWEISLTIVLTLVAIVICTVISARIYRFGVLMYGQKPRLGQLVKLVRRA